jgi:hypothetical protein
MEVPRGGVVAPCPLLAGSAPGHAPPAAIEAPVEEERGEAGADAEGAAEGDAGGWAITHDNDFTHRLECTAGWEDRLEAEELNARREERLARRAFFQKTQYFLLGPPVPPGDRDEIYINNKTWRTQQVTIRYFADQGEVSEVVEHAEARVILRKPGEDTDMVRRHRVADVNPAAALVTSDAEYRVASTDGDGQTLRYLRQHVQIVRTPHPENGPDLRVTVPGRDPIVHQNATFAISANGEEYIVSSRGDAPAEVARYTRLCAVYAGVAAAKTRQVHRYAEALSTNQFQLGSKKSKTLRAADKGFDGWIQDIEITPGPAGCLPTDPGYYRFDGATPGGRCRLSITKTRPTWLQRQWYCQPPDWATASHTNWAAYAAQDWITLFNQRIAPMWDNTNPQRAHADRLDPPVPRIPKRFYMIWLGKLLPETLKPHIVHRKKRFRDYEHALFVDPVAWAKHPDVTEEGKRGLGNWCRENGILLASVREIFGENVEQMVCARQYDFAVRYVPQYKGYAMGSDILRLELLLRFGGWYMDCDYMLYGSPSLFAHCDLVGGCLPSMTATNQDPANGIFGAVRGNEFIRRYLEAIRDGWGNAVLKRLSYNRAGTQRITNFRADDPLADEVAADALTAATYQGRTALEETEALSPEDANRIMEGVRRRFAAEDGPRALYWAIEPGIAAEADSLPDRRTAAANKATIRGTGPKVVRRVLQAMGAAPANAYFGGGLEMLPDKQHRSGPYAWGGEANEAQAW